MTIFLLISGLSLAVLGLLMWRAPRGWQDENGFHLGQEPYRAIEEQAAEPTPLHPATPARRKSAPRRKAA